MGDMDAMFREALAMQLAARDTAMAQIAEVTEFVARHGLVLPKPVPDPPRGRVPHPAAGKSRPQMDQWIRRALADGTLPRPTENLILPPRMIRRAAELGYVEGEGHPYRVTEAGRAFAARSRRGSR